jgi:glycosidase
MNYAYFRDPVTKFLGQGRGTAEEFDHTMATGRNAYPTQAVQVMMNLVGSHDTVRYREQIGGDPKRVKLTALFAMTYVGAPHVYYGDEIGMMGGKDPDCRRPFLWNWKDNPDRVDLHGFYRALGKARAEHVALRRGDFTALQAKGPVYAYARSAGDDRVVVALNTGAAPATVELDPKALGGRTQGVDMVTGKPVDLSGPIALDGVSGIAVVLK